MERVFGGLKDQLGVQIRMHAAPQLIKKFFQQRYARGEVEHDERHRKDAAAVRASLREFLSLEKIVAVIDKSLGDVGRAFVLEELDDSSRLTAIPLTVPSQITAVQEYVKRRCEGALLPDMAREYAASSGATVAGWVQVSDSRAATSSSSETLAQGTVLVVVFSDGLCLCSCRDFYCYSHVCKHALACITSGLFPFHPAAHVDSPYWAESMELTFASRSHPDWLATVARHGAQPALV